MSLVTSLNYLKNGRWSWKKLLVSRQATQKKLNYEEIPNDCTYLLTLAFTKREIRPQTKEVIFLKKEGIQKYNKRFGMNTGNTDASHDQPSHGPVTEKFKFGSVKRDKIRLIKICFWASASKPNMRRLINSKD